MDEELKQFLEGLESRLNARIEAVETRLLRAFHDWSRPYEMRVRHAEMVVRSFDERVSAAEDRLSEVERRLEAPGADRG